MIRQQANFQFSKLVVFAGQKEMKNPNMPDDGYLVGGRGIFLPFVIVCRYSLLFFAVCLI